MMKRNILYFLLILLVPVFLHLSSIAQEKEGTTGSTNAAAASKQSSEKKDASAEHEAQPADKEQTPSLDKGEEKGAAGEAKKEAKKKIERKKKEAKKQPEKKEAEKKEEMQGDMDRSSVEGLLLIDNENIQNDRIPGITIKKEEPGQDLVKIPDDKISDTSKEKKKSEGIFGNKTKTIAGWGIVILIFILFAIYSKKRSRKTRRGTVRTITKR